MPYLLKTICINNVNYNIFVANRQSSKNIILRFNQAKNQLRISAPIRTSKTEINQFLQAQQASIEGFLQKNHTQKISLNEGLIVPIFGIKHRLVRAQNSAQPSENPLFLVKCGNKPFEQAASVQLQRSLLHYSTRKMQEIINAPPFNELRITPQINLRKTRSRYGSCCPKTGRIMLCTSLVFAPISVLNSVIFHEVAHLIYANHSADFRGLVAQIDAHYTTSKAWLKNHSKDIFCYEM